jgi:tetratricopeptide (TPR) repeat protein
MNEWRNDSGPEEEELLKTFGTSFEALRASHADCPKPEILLAAQAGVLEEETARSAAAHLEKCGYCKVLLRDLTDGEVLAALPEEERRVRGRVLGAAGISAKAEKAGGGLLTAGLRWALPVAALAGVVVAAVVWMRLHPPVAPVLPAPSVAVGPAKTTPSALEWEKLAVKLEASSILVWRGKPRNEQEKYAAELTHALVYYRDGDYAEAVQQLERVENDFPRGVEGQLYLGISRLALQQDAAAIPALLAAQRLGVEQFREDASWYLALAYARSGDKENALTELRRLCQGKGRYAQRACAGLQELIAASGEALPR